MRWLLPLQLSCGLLLAISACSQKSEPEKSEPKKIVTTMAPAIQRQAKTEKNKPAAAPKATASTVAGTESQSFAQGLTALCESYEKAPKSDSPIESQKLLHAYIEKNVTNEKVRELFTIIGQMPPSQRGAMLRAAAAKSGISTCSLAGP